MTNTHQLHAVLPATGRSRRMGQQKLLMEIGGQSVISRLITALSDPRISSISVSVRSDDRELQAEVERLGARVVIPQHDPEEMKVSVVAILDSLRGEVTQPASAGWMLVPSDHPFIDPDTRQRVIEAWESSLDSIIVPSHQGKRGHPTIFPWSLAESLDLIPEDRGLNWFLQESRTPIKEVECEHPSVLWDIDTPEDFQRISKFIQE